MIILKNKILIVEILFTPYYRINIRYKKYWDELIEHREDIAHYNMNQAVRCMAGMSMEKKKALCHPYPSLIDKIEKYGYDGKQLHHIIRMFDFITAYCDNKDFEECLHYLPHKKQMMEAKLQEYSLEEALELAESYDTLTKSIKDLWIENNPEDVIDEVAKNLLYDTQYKIIKNRLIYNLREEELK